MMFQGTKDYIAQICEVNLKCKFLSNINSILFDDKPIVFYVLNNCQSRLRNSSDKHIDSYVSLLINVQT